MVAVKGIDDMNVKELKAEMKKRRMMEFSKLKLHALRSKLKKEVNSQRVLAIKWRKDDMIEIEKEQ